MTHPVLAGALLILSASLAGCGGYTSESLPYDQNNVWWAAVAEVMPLRPLSVDEKNFHAFGNNNGVGGTQVEYEVSVIKNDWGMHPSCTLNVRMEQVKPDIVRNEAWEREFVERVRARLQASQPQ